MRQGAFDPKVGQKNILVYQIALSWFQNQECRHPHRFFSVLNSSAVIPPTDDSSSSLTVNCFWDLTIYFHAAFTPACSTQLSEQAGCNSTKHLGSGTVSALVRPLPMQKSFHVTARRRTLFRSSTCSVEFGLFVLISKGTPSSEVNGCERACPAPVCCYTMEWVRPQLAHISK